MKPNIRYFLILLLGLLSSTAFASLSYTYEITVYKGASWAIPKQQPAPVPITSTPQTVTVPSVGTSECEHAPGEICVNQVEVTFTNGWSMGYAPPISRAGVNQVIVEFLAIAQSGDETNAMMEKCRGVLSGVKEIIDDCRYSAEPKDLYLITGYGLKAPPANTH